jgi:hypothetical protein
MDLDQRTMRISPTSWNFPLGGTNIFNFSQKFEGILLSLQRGRTCFLYEFGIQTFEARHSTIHPKELLHQLLSGKAFHNSS